MNLKDILNFLISIKEIVITIVGVITAIVLFGEKLKEMWDKILKPLWNKVLKPLLKYIIVLASLTIPNVGTIWLLMYWVAEEKFEIRDRVVFVQLVIYPAAFICLYSFLWGILIYPKVLRSWLNTTKPSV